MKTFQFFPISLLKKCICHIFFHHYSIKNFGQNSLTKMFIAKKTKKTKVVNIFLWEIATLDISQSIFPLFPLWQTSKGYVCFHRLSRPESSRKNQEREREEVSDQQVLSNFRYSIHCLAARLEVVCFLSIVYILFPRIL